MRRPLVVIAAAVLSGTLYGLPGIPFVYRLVSAAVPAAAGLLLAVKCRGRHVLPLYFLGALFMVSMAAGYFRASSETKYFLKFQDYYSKYEATNPGEFDYADYLKSLHVTNEDERLALKEGSGRLPYKLQKVFAEWKQNCESILDYVYPEEDATVAKAMLLGEKQELGDEVKSLYQKSGIAHLLAVSGLHVSMVGAGVTYLFSTGLKAGKKTLSVVSAAVVFIYAAFTGASVSSMRAALMFAVGSAALFPGRKKDLPSSLSLAAVVLIIYRPYCVSQSGFQLSFLAIAGIIYASWITSQWKTGKTPATCLGVTLFTMPAVAFSYYKVPFYSILLNLAVIPLMSVVFLSGSAAVFIGLFSKVPAFIFGTGYHGEEFLRFLSVIAAAPGRIVLKIYTVLSEFSLSLPGAEILTGKPSHVQIVLFYLFLLAAGAAVRALKDRKSANILLTAVYLAAFPMLLYREIEETYVTVLDVGQGDCMHIHEGAKDILIDCGSSGYESAGSRILKNYMLSKRISSIDLIIVTHADSDHTNGILYLYSEESGIETGQMCLPFLAQADEKYDALKKAADGNFFYCRTGDVYRAGNLSLRCIYCEEDKSAMSDTNRESSVFYLTAGKFSMLFTGDITSEEERKIAESGTLAEMETDVLKCAHHGSDTANSELFLEAVNPDWAVLSYGKNNRYGHPSVEVTARLQKKEIAVLSTEKCGALTFRIREQGYEILSYKNGKSEK